MGKKSHEGHRSSVTGKFVTERYAEKHPAKTQKESIPNPGYGTEGGNSGGKKRGK